MKLPKNSFLPLILYAIAMLSAGCRAGRTATATNLERSLDDLVAPFLSNNSVPGMSLAVVENGHVIYAKGFGTTALTTKSPPTADTQYRLASVTKTFTAVAVLRLVQDGKVKLDEPARQYCPELSSLNGGPTVRHFLRHQSGMRHTTDSEDESITGRPARIGDGLISVAHEPLQFAPGTKTLYTSWGYTALGCVIETASGQSYSDFVKQHIFDPAGLTSTTFDRPDYMAPQFSPGFRSGILWGLRPSLVVDTRFKLPASGIISTANDLVRFVAAIFDGELISQTQMKEMFSVPHDGAFTPGWVFKAKLPYGLEFDNNGSMEGATAFIDTVPDRRYALVLLANRERYTAKLQPIVTEARRLVLDPAQ